MLDVEQYDLAEKMARLAEPHYWYAAPHGLDTFQYYGFPTRANNVGELRALVDAFHESRFDSFMAELGGIDPQETDHLIKSLVSAVELQLRLFPNRRPVIPVSAMLAMLCLHRKMIAIRGDFKTVLDIGPGCGYTSFFLGRHTPLQSYVQVEVCQSLYLLQSAVNGHIFGPSAKENAFPDLTGAGNFFGVTVAGDWEHIDSPPLAGMPAILPKCEHIPWWRLGEIAARKGSFDIVTSNANLNEFSETAFNLYLNLISTTLNDAGLFLIQCSGADRYGRRATLPTRLMEHGLAVIHFCSAGESIPQSEAGVLGREFAKDSILAVKRGHQAFDAHFGKHMDNFNFFGDEKLISRMFISDPGNRKVLTIAEIIELVDHEIAKSGVGL